MPNSEDTIRELQKRPALPQGRVAGTRLTWVGPGPYDYELVGDQDQQVREFNGDPNTLVFAPKGTLGIQREVPALWQNTDGVSAWSLVSAGTTTTTQHDYFLDPTGTSLATAGLLTWVIAASSYPASDGLLDLSTPTLPEVVTPGIYTVELFVDLPADDLANQQILATIARGGGPLVVLVQGAPMSSTDTLAGSASLTMRHECEAGDLFIVQVNFGGGGSHTPYKLNATVEAEV